MSLSFAETRRPRRRPNLTPMIDVVFLLLVFFMLAAQFGADMSLPLKVGGPGAAYNGPPRLVDITPGTVTLNGKPLTPDELITRLKSLTETQSDTIVLRARQDADVQRVIETMEQLKAGGFSSFVLLE